MWDFVSCWDEPLYSSPPSKSSPHIGLRLAHSACFPTNPACQGWSTAYPSTPTTSLPEKISILSQSLQNVNTYQLYHWGISNIAPEYHCLHNVWHDSTTNPDVRVSEISWDLITWHCWLQWGPPSPCNRYIHHQNTHTTQSSSRCGTTNSLWTWHVVLVIN